MTDLIVFTNNKWVTPMGHEFSTRGELDAFIDGIKFCQSIIDARISMSLENLFLSEKVL